MGNRFDDLKRYIIRKRDFESKKKLVKMLRREVHDIHKEAKLDSVDVGFNGQDVVAIINCDYGNAIIIKDALKGNRIMKYFDIRVKVDETYPTEALPMGEKGLNLGK